MNEFGYFVGNPKLEFLPGGESARLLEDFTYVDRKGRHHVAKAGMRTDGGSIPRFFWRIIGSPFTGPLPAYLIHDWYWERARSVGDWEAKQALKRSADQLFREMLDTLGVGFGRRWAMYLAVRAAAWVGN